MQTGINGIIVLDKPEGFTSNDAVQKLRGITRQRRCGHSGTLDPMATGVLPVFFGCATRAVEYTQNDDKEYTAAFRLGIETDTEDITGNVLKTSPVRVSREDVLSALSRFTGDILQTPPMYSALCVDGQRLYKLARAGVTVERKAREIHIESISLSGDEMPENEYKIHVKCSKGTYIRTLCADIGAYLGAGAAMTYLRRTSSGIFSLSDAFSFDELQKMRDSGDISPALIPVDRVFSHLPAISVDDYGEIRLRNGAFCPARSVIDGGDAAFENGQMKKNVRVYDKGGRFIAIARQGLLESGKTAIFLVKNFFEK